MEQEIKRLFKGIHASSTIHKILRENPSIGAYAQEKLRNFPLYEKPTYYIISVANDISLSSCPVCGKTLTYSQSTKNNTKFCCVYCAKKYLYANKEKAKKKKSVKPPKLPLFQEDRVTLKKLRELYSGTSQFRIYGILSSNPKVENFANLALKRNPQFQSTTKLLYCLLNNLKLKKCDTCGKTLTYHQSFTRKSSCCSTGCSHRSDSYVKKQKTVHQLKKFKVLKERAWRSGFKIVSSLEQWKDSTEVALKCCKCGLTFSVTKANVYRDMKCPSCDKSLSLSFEKQIRDYIISLGVDVECNKRVLDGNKELDIIIPSKNIAIECDGLYFHSSKGNKTKTYHLEKTEECQRKNLSLIHVFEDEWKIKEKIVKAKLRHILGKDSYTIKAKSCTIKEISKEVCSAFLKKYHIQGDCVSSVRLGLFKKTRLVGVMSFLKVKCEAKSAWKLLRYATIQNFNILDGESKLISYFTRKNKEKIIYAVDRRWSNGDSLIKIGFREVRNTPPNCFYTKNLKRTLSPDSEEMKWSKIWDCGNKILSLE